MNNDNNKIFNPKPRPNKEGHEELSGLREKMTLADLVPRKVKVGVQYSAQGQAGGRQWSIEEKTRKN